VREKFYWILILFDCLMLASITSCGVPAQEIQTPSPDPFEDVFEVTFDGNECTLSGPTELPAGEHTIPLNNLSDYPVFLWIGQPLNGKTWQDGLDLQSYPTEYVLAPDWYPRAKNTYYGYDPKSDRTRTIFTYIFEDPGEYHVWVESKSDLMLWPCAPFSVFEDHSE